MRNTIPQSSFWIYFSAILLPFNGGLINGITLVSFLHNSVGYVTGNLVYAGTSFSSAENGLFLHLIVLILCFLMGAVVSGLMIRSEFYSKNHRYELNLILQLVIVTIAMILMAHNHRSCEYLLAAAMGLQNAMTTHYGTALIRTTHMTGTTTDLGVLIAHIIKGNRVQQWKLGLYLILIVCFLFGAIAGGYFYHQFQAYGLVISMLIYLTMIVAYKY
jgi:uncharacterized membrane protein YoaK (UPF0700 family)